MSPPSTDALVVSDGHLTRGGILMRGRRDLLIAAVAAVLLGLVVAPASPAAAQPVAQNAVVNANPADYTPHVLDGSVKSIVQVGNTIILGGTFSQVQAASGGTVLSRNNVVAFDATTGAISTTFVPRTDGEVTTVLAAADGQSVYLAGFFNTVNGTASKSLARVSVSNGALVTTFRVPSMDGRVKDLRMAGGRLWVAGTFATVAGHPQAGLTTLNPNTGAFDAFMSLTFEGARNGGVLQVMKIDVNANGSRLIGMGNFSTVAGVSHPQLVMLDLTGTSAGLADWGTQVYDAACAPVFDSYMRDLDFSPDGSFFVVTTTGAYGGNQNTNPCDTSMRWETGATGQGVMPTWVTYTGGDTTYAVAVTGTAVYTGGHFRWQNNPYAGDQPGPGAVAREGITALDPLSGLPFSWNPGRTKGVGVFDMLATSAGLWVASDTDRIGNFEYHGRIAFFPLAGGTTIPAYNTGTVPGHVFVGGGQLPGPAPAAVLYRVNAGGDTLPSADAGPDWAGDSNPPDPHHNNVSNTAGYDPVGSIDSTVPTSTPTAIFDAERWDPGDDPEMAWDFPVAAGTPIQVRLYFANRYDGTANAGDRVFDVNLDGTTVLDDFDISGTVGHNVGTMRSFDITSDGDVNIDFGHVVENSLIDGIEIIRTDIAAPSTPANPDDLRDVYFDGTSGSRQRVLTTTGIPWSSARGSVMINGSVYTGYADGAFTRRTFNGTSFGAPVAVDGADRVVPLDNWHTDVSRMTGLFFSGDRMYYTVAGSSTLYYRGFNPQSDVVGALRMTASANVDGIDFARVSGMFLAGGKLYFGSAVDGSLHRIDWSGSAPVAGSATTLETPQSGGEDWRSRSTFLYTGTNLPAPAPNQPPTATFSQACTQLNCSFDGSGSSDPDGSITSYAWTFGDGASGNGATTSHAYAAAGNYSVTLTVTDNKGVVGTSTRQITVGQVNQPPVASITSQCTNLACSFDGSASSDPEGPIASYAWNFGDGGTASGATANHTYTAAGTYDVSLTVTDSNGATNTATQSVSVSTVPESRVAFVGASTTNANWNTFQVTVPSTVAAGDSLVLLATTATTVTVSSPSGGTGWQQISSVPMGGTNGTTTVWSKVAAAGDAGQTITVNLSAIAKTGVTLLAYTGTDTTNPVSAVQASAETVNQTGHTTPSVSVARAGSLVVSYWADRSSTTTAWTPPSAETLRSQTIGAGGGHISTLVTDSGTGVAAGTRAGLTANADSASPRASMVSLVLAPR
jgi:PKD repeat protein